MGATLVIRILLRTEGRQLCAEVKYILDHGGPSPVLREPAPARSGLLLSGSSRRGDFGSGAATSGSEPRETLALGEGRRGTARSWKGKRTKREGKTKKKEQKKKRERPVAPGEGFGRRWPPAPCRMKLKLTHK